MTNDNCNQWRECKLEDVAVFQRGHDLPKTEMNLGSIPVAGSNGIIGYHDRATTKGPGITIGRSGNIGTPKFYKDDFWAHNTVLYVKDFKGNDEKFVFYFLQIFDFAGFNAGSAVPTLNRNHIHEIPVVVPSLPEQRAIAAVLSSLDDKIDLLNRQNKTLEGLAATIWRKMFTEDADPNWKITIFSEHVGTSRGLSYKGNGLAEINMGMPMHNLNSVYEGGGYKYEGIKYYTGNYQDRHVIKPGDIIVTNTEQGHEFRLIGFPAVVPHCFGEKGIFSQHIYKLNILKKSYLTTQFIYYLIMTPKVREQIIGATNGSTVNMLAIDGLQRPEFSLPPEEKVKQFSETVKLFWQKQAENKTEIGKLSTLRDSLLPKLMSGEVMVKI
jgi:type I restriction enzyme S subunit